MARYRVGGFDPSRTSVAPNGDAYVACRGADQKERAGVTKVVADINDCVDRNNDGFITTSRGPGDLLADDYPDWAQDECVIWHTQLPDFIRGVAVQVMPEKVDIVDVADGPPEITITPGQSFICAGGNSDTPRIFKLSADTGEVLIDVPSPIESYGFALDGRHRMANASGGPYLWISGDNETQNMAHVDTSQCTGTATAKAVSPPMPKAPASRSSPSPPNAQASSLFKKGLLSSLACSLAIKRAFIKDPTATIDTTCTATAYLMSCACRMGDPHRQR